jgi:hypothetical protein
MQSKSHLQQWSAAAVPYKSIAFLCPSPPMQNICLFMTLAKRLPSSFQQVPPLTPSSNKKVNEVLKTTYATWDKDSERLAVPKDPRVWTKEHVGHWLSWAIREFSLAGPNSSQFVQQFQVKTTKNDD